MLWYCWISGSLAWTLLRSVLIRMVGNFVESVETKDSVDCACCSFSTVLLLPDAAIFKNCLISSSCCGVELMNRLISLSANSKVLKAVIAFPSSCDVSLFAAHSGIVDDRRSSLIVG